MKRADVLIDPPIHPRSRSRTVCLAALALLATLLVPGLAGTPAGADVGGTLDSSYGSGDGIVERPARFRPSELGAVDVDSSGRVLTATTGGPDDAGRTYITRYLANGTIDPSFGTAGVTTMTSGPDIERIVARSDGTILLGGTIDAAPEDDFYVARLTSTGSFDDTFGGDGRISLDAGTIEVCDEFGCSDRPATPSFADVVARGDNLIAGGYAWVEYDCSFGGCYYEYETRMWQVLEDGTVDPGFIGELVLSQTVPGNGVIDFAVDAQQRIYCLVGGMTVVRLFAGGSIDSSFSGDGVAVASFSGVEGSRGMAIDNNGRPMIVGEGNLDSATVDDVVMARFTTGGNLDTSFSGDGRHRLSLVTGDDYVRSVRIDSSGRLLLAASRQSDGGLVARFTAAGALDSSFAGNGKAAVPGSVILNDIARNGNKIVAAGYTSEHKATVSRLTSTGVLDTAFGGDGHAPTEVFAPDSSYQAIAVQPDGKAVAVGGAGFAADDPFVVTRLGPTGTVDTTFPEVLDLLPYGGVANDVAVTGSDVGVTVDEFDPFDPDLLLLRYREGVPETFVNLGNGHLQAVAADADGRFVVAGTVDGPAGADVVVARVVSGGALTPDPTFGTGGIVKTSVSTGTDRASAVAVQPDGKIVVVGTSFVSGAPRLLVMRYTANGQLDPTFSGDGWIRINVTGDDEGNTVALTAEGGIVVAGTGSTVTEDRMVVAKLTPAGVLDPSFGSGGKLNFRVGLARGSAVNAVAVDAQGRINLAGSADAGVSGEVALVRVNADGSPDIGLTGSTNFVLTSIGAGDDVGLGLAVQPDGRILIAGSGDTATGTEAVVLAYRGVTTTVSVIAGSQFEGDTGTTTLTFLVGLDAQSTGPVSVHYATADGTATAGVDYVAMSGNLTFTPGQVMQAVPVVLNGDLGAETHETVHLVLSAPSNARLGANGVGTITDDDSAARPPSVSVSGPTAVPESVGATGVTFTVNLTSASSLPVQVDAATLNGTAIAPGDYTPMTATIAFTPGETSRTMVVPIADDVLDEANETFSVGLSNPQHTTIASGLATTRIDDNDAAPTVTIADVSVIEGDSGTKNLTFVVTLSAASGRAVKVDYATADITATAGNDYIAKAGTLTIPALTGSGPIVVKVNGDLVVEPNETLAVTLANPIFATIADGDAVGTINNND